MAYVLGFWFADGHMRHERSYRIGFSSLDGTHLESIKQALKSSSPLFHSRRFGEYERAYTFLIHSKSLFHDLLALGGIPSKSTTIKFPFIPIQFLVDFVRGYFDGDGSVHYISYRASKNNKIYTNLRSNFTSGSADFLEKLRSILNEQLSLSLRKVCQYGPHQFKLGYDQKDTVTLLKFMYYPECNLFLDRKYEIYKKYLASKTTQAIPSQF